MNDNDITLTEAEERALHLMEAEATGTGHADDADGDEGCASVCAEMMLMETAMRTSANPEGISPAGELRRFHAKRHRKRAWRIYALAAAATAMLLIALVPFVQKQSSQNNEAVTDARNVLYKACTEQKEEVTKTTANAGEADWQTVSTPHGKTKTLVLPDGTEVTLSTNSRLHYPTRFTGQARTVTLEGEGYFSVAKDRRHPFIVRSGGIETKALGTTFDVRCYDGSKTQVILIEGKVQLSDTERTRQTEMLPGQRAVWDGERTFTVYDNADRQTDLAWKDGYLYFDAVTFGTMMREIGRWYNIDVTTVPSPSTDTALKSRVHFYIPVSQTIEQTVRMLNRQDIATVALTAGGITISGKK